MSLSIFGGLETARQALLSHQYEINTIGHNIANVDTPGFTRQRPILATSLPLSTPDGSIGTGVTVSTVRQMRDYFLTGQYRRENEQRGSWESLNRTMSLIENVFLEPNDNQLNELVNNFFDAWQSLSTRPDSQSERSNLREQAQVMANEFQRNSLRLSGIAENVNAEIGARVEEINQRAALLADINRQINNAELSGHSANDLRDRRDNIVDELSGMVKVSVIEESTGAARIFIGSMELVGNGHYQRLGTMTVAQNDTTVNEIVWENTTTRVTALGGELQALIKARDEIVPGYIAQLDELAQGIVEGVNALHLTGFGLNDQTGMQFFNPEGVTASTIDLSDDVKADLNNIAASSAEDSPGNNIVALNIAGLKSSPMMKLGTVSYSEYYASLVGNVGVRASEAADSFDSFTLVVDQLEFQRQSVQGVSLDEEMANMIRAQHAYDAAARMVMTINQVIGTIVNELGVGMR